MSNEVWPFEEPRNLAVLALRQIMEENAPVLHVSHDSDDGSWQFLGWETPEMQDVLVVGLASVVKLDPTLLELADLPLGWHAWREKANDPWMREPNPDDAGDDQ